MCVFKGIVGLLSAYL